MLAALRTVFARDLATLRREVALYPDDALPWKEVPGCPNTGGALALHLAGNLRHFVGAQLGGSGYVRDRDAEFGTRGTSRAALDTVLAAAAEEVDRALAALDPARLEEPVALPRSAARVPLELWLLHLATHLAFHLGQVDYHRRAVTGDRAGAGAVSVEALAP